MRENPSPFRYSLSFFITKGIFAEEIVRYSILQSHIKQAILISITAIPLYVHGPNGELSKYDPAGG